MLDVHGRAGPSRPRLRFERADGRRLLLRQGERPLLLGRSVGAGCCPEFRLHRLDGYRSPPALRTGFPPGIWTEDFVREWATGQLGLCCGGGWHGVLPLRRLSAPDAGRVKAYRKHAREGALAPVLLWWVTFLDGFVILDGHDRAVAAPAEGRPRSPSC